MNEASDKLKGGGRDSAGRQGIRLNLPTKTHLSAIHDWLRAVDVKEAFRTSHGYHVQSCSSFLKMRYSGIQNFLLVFLRERIDVARLASTSQSSSLGLFECWDSRQVLSYLVPEYKVLKNFHL